VTDRNEINSFSTKRREILEACLKDEVYLVAAELLRSEGHKGLTMDRIAKEVGVSRPTLYNYFTDSNDLLIFVERRVHETVVAAVDKITTGTRPAPEKLKAVATTIVDHRQADRTLTLALFRRLESGGRHAVSWLHTREQLKNALYRIVENGIEQGELDPNLNPNVAVGVLLSSVQGLVDAQSQFDTPFGHQTTDVMNLLLKGLLPRAGSVPV
jgi:AcrR family transcriptional regulator